MNTWKLTENEKEKAIKAIVCQGVVSPGDKIREAVHVGRACSLRVLFFGVGDCLFLGSLLSVCLWLFFMQVHTKTILCSVFALSPLAYICCFAFTTWKEHLVQLYEVKMSCHFTIRQVIAFRMIYLSFGNMLLNTLALSLLTKTQMMVIPFWKTLGLSFSSLFLYGILMLFFQIKGRMYLSAVLPAILWGMGNLFLILCCGNQVERFLLNLTDTLVAGIVSGSLAAYLFTLYSYFTARDREELQNVIG